MPIRLTGFVQELVRRRVMRVLGMYLVGAFVLLQVGDVTFDALGLPEWSQRLLIALLLLGLPLVSVLAWVFDITPEGIVRTSAQDDGEIHRLQSGRKFNIAVIIALLLAVGFLIGRDYLRGPAHSVAAPVTDRSVAVLRFTSIDTQGDNRYFADGLTEELISTLAMIPDLRVAARQSSLGMGTDAFSDAQAGGTLNVAHLVKGSVRRAGDDVRVAAQLVRVSDNTVLWSRSFEKTFDDVSAIQDAIAQGVATSLKSTLYKQVVQRLALERTDNVAAYDAYLVALHYRAMRWDRAVEHAKRAVTLDPQFVAAHTLLADAYMRRVGGTIPAAQAYPLARRSVNAALAIAPDYGPAVVVHAHLERMSGNYDAAERLFREAKVRAPNMVSSDLANLLLTVGRTQEALEEHRRSYELDPLNRGFYQAALVSAGEYRLAQELQEEVLDLLPAEQRPYSCAQGAMLYAFLGETQRATALADEALRDMQRSVYTGRGQLGYALALLGRTAEARAIADELEARAAQAYVSPAGPFWTYVGLNDHERAFAWLNRVVDEDVYLVIVGLKTSPMYDQLRDDPRFHAALDRLGLLTDV
jgi:TolB-like protein